MLHRYQTQNHEMKEKGLNILENFINNLESLCKTSSIIKKHKNHNKEEQMTLAFRKTLRTIERACQCCIVIKHKITK